MLKNLVYISPTAKGFCEYDTGFLNGLVANSHPFDQIYYFCSESCIIDGVKPFFSFTPAKEETNRFRKILKYISGWRSLMKLIPNERNSIIHINYSPIPLIDRAFISQIKSKGSPIIFTPHDILPFAHERIRMIGRKKLFELADRVVFHSTHNMKEAQSIFSVEEGKSVLMKHGLPPIEDIGLNKQIARRSLGILPGEKCILFFGTIKTEKGLDVLVKALTDLKTPDIRFTLIVAGEDVQSVGGKLLKSTFNRTKNTFRILSILRRVSDEEKARLFLSSDFVVLPYKKIYASGVLKDSIAYGLPVIASNIGELAEVITSYRIGETFPVGESKKLSTIIERFLLDQELIDIYSANSRVAKSSFSWNNTILPLIEAYWQLAGRLS